MYNLPPPKEALEWSFGLLFDVALRIGLGKDKPGKTYWTIPEISKAIDLESAQSRVKKWRYGNRIMDADLEALIEALSANERYADEWRHVIATCSGTILKTIEIEAQRDRCFQTRTFPNRENAAHDLITKALSTRETYLIDDVTLPSVTETASQKGCVLDSLVNDIDLRKLFFQNIHFCQPKDFDHNANRCLKPQTEFEHGTTRVHLSFESQVLKEDARFNLKWFRYGQLIAETTKTWTETFAHDLRYAATHLGDGSDTVMKPGMYQVQMVKGDHILGEASFTIK